MQQQEKNLQGYLYIQLVKSDPDALSEYPLYEGDNNIGSDIILSDIQIPFEQISKQHCSIRCEDQEFTLIDHGSVSGVFKVLKKGIDQSTIKKLKPGVQYDLEEDQDFQIGDFLCCVKLRENRIEKFINKFLNEQKISRQLYNEVQEWEKKSELSQYQKQDSNKIVECSQEQQLTKQILSESKIPKKIDQSQDIQKEQSEQSPQAKVKVFVKKQFQPPKRNLQHPKIANKQEISIKDSNKNSNAREEISQKEQKNEEPKSIQQLYKNEEEKVIIKKKKQQKIKKIKQKDDTKEEKNVAQNEDKNQKITTLQNKTIKVNKQSHQKKQSKIQKSEEKKKKLPQVESLFESQLKYLPSKRNMFRVIFSLVKPSNYELDKLKKLGIIIEVDRDKLKFNIVIMEKFERSVKFLLAINIQAQILSYEWIKQCLQDNRINTDLNQFQLKIDEENQKKYDLDLPKAMKRREKNDPLFQNYYAWFPKDIRFSGRQGYAEMAILIKSGGGKIIDIQISQLIKQINEENIDKDSLIIIINENDNRLAQKIKEQCKEIKYIYTSEFVLNSICQQKLLFKQYQI